LVKAEIIIVSEFELISVGTGSSTNWQLKYYV